MFIYIYTYLFIYTYSCIDILLYISIYTATHYMCCSISWITYDWETSTYVYIYMHVCICVRMYIAIEPMCQLSARTPKQTVKEYPSRVRPCGSDVSLLFRIGAYLKCLTIPSWRYMFGTLLRKQRDLLKMTHCQIRFMKSLDSHS